MNQSAKQHMQNVEMYKTCERPDIKTTCKHEVWNDSYFAPQGGGGVGGWYSGLQMTGMIKGFLGVWNFRFWDFFGSENFGKYFFG